MKRLLAFTLLATGFAGCSLLGSDDVARLDLQFFARSEAQEQSDFRITIIDGLHVRTLGREDFTQAGDVQFDAGPFETATSGDLRVACALLNTEGATLAGEAVTLPLRSDWRYGVSCTVGPSNPYHVCFGCSGFETRPLDPALGFAPGDSLFVVWGGTSISSPVDY